MAVSISKLRYTDAEHTCIDMMVDLDGNVIPFHYMPGDKAPVTLLVESLLAEGNYTIAPFEEKQ